jgi:threonine/homoserine/homoserine lactone efflux protein
MNIIDFLTMGIILGLSAGVSPGPLQTLVISETLQHDVKSGVKVALAPVVSDLPIIFLTVFLLSKLTNFHAIVGGLSLAGGFFILSLGIAGIRTRGIEFDQKKTESRSIAKGVLTNVLSPYPYLFWLSVGAPLVTKAFNQAFSAAAAFILGFYVCLVGSKIVLALLVGKSKNLLRSKGYIYTMRFLGMMLCGLAVVLFRDGLRLLQIR